MAENNSGIVAIFAIFIIIVLGVIGYYFYTNEARLAPGDTSTTVIQNEVPAPTSGGASSTSTTKSTSY